MAGYKHYQVDRNKFGNSLGVFGRGRNFRKDSVNKTEKLMNGIATWTSFYRANPHRFVEDYLGIALKPFQKILIYFMMHFNYLIYLAARGQGKNTIMGEIQ